MLKNTIAAIRKSNLNLISFRKYKNILSYNYLYGNFSNKIF